MGRMGDYGQQLKFRDDLKTMIAQGINSYTVGPKQGVVQSGSDSSSGFVNIVPNSETDPVAYAVGAIQADAGAVVLVDGPNGNRRIVDVITRGSTRFNGRYLEAWDNDLSVRAMGQTGGTARRVFIDHSSQFLVRYGAPGTTPTNTVVADNVNFRLYLDLALQGTSTIRVGNLNTTTGTANVRWTGDYLYQVSSLSGNKLDLQEIDVDYKFLNMKTYSWRDAGEVSRDPDVTRRYTGTTVEEVENLGYEEFLTRHEITGETIGVESPSFYSKLIPILRSVVMRLNVQEGKRYDAGLV